MRLKVAILIPSYKRLKVLEHTLCSLFFNSQMDAKNNYEVGVFLGLNKAREEDIKIAHSFVEIASACNIFYAFVPYSDNIGKALALNDLFDKYSSRYDYIVTMDNDMVIKKPWLHLINVALKKDFELTGFASTTFWAHLPKREECPFEEVDKYKFYQPYNGIAGGMMLFPRRTLEKHKWTNKGGVYGFDDAQMCLDVNNKGVLYDERDWLDHDPLSCSTPELKYYHDRKQHFFNQGQYILQKGWDS